MVNEYERAFAGDQLLNLAPLLDKHGVQLWLSEAGGPVDLADGRRGHREVLRWNPAQDWVISKKMAHAGLVSEADFVAAQAIRASRPTGDGTTRTYLLAGLPALRAADRWSSGG